MAEQNDLMVQTAVDAAAEEYQSLVESGRSSEGAIDGAARRAYEVALKSAEDAATASAVAGEAREALIESLLREGGLEDVHSPEVDGVRVKLAAQDVAEDTFENLVGVGCETGEALDQAGDSAYQRALLSGMDAGRAQQIAQEVRNSIAERLMREVRAGEGGDLDRLESVGEGEPFEVEQAGSMEKVMDQPRLLEAFQNEEATAGENGPVISDLAHPEGLSGDGPFSFGNMLTGDNPGSDIALIFGADHSGLGGIGGSGTSGNQFDLIQGSGLMRTYLAEVGTQGMLDPLDPNAGEPGGEGSGIFVPGIGEGGGAEGNGDGPFSSLGSGVDNDPTDDSSDDDSYDFPADTGDHDSAHVSDTLIDTGGSSGSSPDENTDGTSGSGGQTGGNTDPNPDPGPQPIPEGSVTVSRMGSESITEGYEGSSRTVVFTVSRSQGQGATSVDWEVAGDGIDADDFADGTQLSGTISFADGETEKNIELEVTGDKIIEIPVENCIIRITNPGEHLSLGDATQASVAIQDDDQGYDISIVEDTKDELSAGETRTYTFVVRRSGDTMEAAAIKWRAIPYGENPAGPSDYQAGQDGLGTNSGMPSGTLNFAAGETEKTVTVITEGDNDYGPSESFAVVLTDPPAGTIVLSGTAAAVIENDDAIVSVSAVAPDKAEGSGEDSVYRFVLTRSGVTDTASSVKYHILSSGDTGTDANDFVAGQDALGNNGGLPSGIVHFAEGQDRVEVEIRIKGDSHIEGNENFVFRLSDPGDNLEIGSSQTAATILDDDVSVSIAAYDAARLEGNDQTQVHTFELTRVGNLDLATTVNWTVRPGGDNPVDASDFGGALPSGTVTFQPGESRLTIEITPSADLDFESSETYDVVISLPNPGASLANDSARGTIISDESALSISAGSSPSEGDNGATSYSFVISRTGVTDTEISVDWAIESGFGDGVEAFDFSGGVFPSGTVTFAQGEAQKIVTVQIAADSNLEADESFVIKLSNPSEGGTIVLGEVTKVIENDDAAFSIEAVDTSVVEGQSGTTLYTFKITRTGDTTGSDSVEYAVTGDGDHPMDAVDFGGTLPSEAVTFAANETEKLVQIAVKSDDLVEGTETFKITLTNPTAGSEIVSGHESAVGTVIGDDDVIGLTTANVDGAEGSGPGGVFTFTLTRTGDASTSSSVDWSIAGTGQNATDNADFTGVSGTVVFAAGETTKTIEVQAVGDGDIESDENFTLTLSNASAGTTLGTDTATGTVLNDDIGLAIAAVESNTAEGDQGTVRHVFTVTRTGVLTGNTTVDWTIAGIGGNPVDASDFSAVSGTVTFNPGETSKDIEVFVVSDGEIENTESYSITLSNASSGADVTTASAAGTIVTDDAQLAIFAMSATATEGAAEYSSIIQFKVVRSGDVSSAVSAVWNVSGDVDAGDISSDLTGTVHFEAGQTEKFISLTLTGDDAVEADEAVTVTLSNPTITDGGATSSVVTAQGTDSATVIVQNDDSVLSIAGEAASKAEGTDGETVELTFTVTRAGDLSEEATVNWTLVPADSDGANINDFIADQDALGNNNGLPSGTLTFAAGGAATQTVTVRVKGDTPVEVTEKFNIVLSDPSDNTELGTSVAQGTIENDDIGFSITPLDANKDEGHFNTTEFTFEVVRAGDVDSVGYVDYQVSGVGGDSADEADFGGAFASGTLEFAEGEVRKVITLNVAADTVMEADEGFKVAISNARLEGGASQTIVTSEAVGTIVSDDNSFSIVANAAQVGEGDNGITNVTFTVTRLGDSSGEVQARYEVTGGSGADGSDFEGGTLPSGVVTFGDGEMSKTITLPIQTDDAVEGDETFTVTLKYDLPGGAEGSASAQTVVLNDDCAFSIVATAASVFEGDSGNTAVTYTVTRTGDMSTEASVQWAVIGGGDFNQDDMGGNLPSGTLTFAANGPAQQTITVNVSGDSAVESDETMTVRLTNPTGSIIAQDGDSASTVVSGDEDLFSIEAAQAGIAEGHSGSTNLVFNVTRSGSLNGAKTVSYTISGTGVDASDINGGSLSGTVEFADGQDSAQILVPIKGDTVVEDTETVKVTLVQDASHGILVGTGAAEADVSNDDSVVSISALAADKGEGNTGVVPYTFTVTRIGNTDQESDVHWSVQGTGGNDPDSDDFSGTGLPSGTVHFSSGSSSETITVEVACDSNLENDETFNIVLSSPSAGTVIDTASAAATIRDDDAEINFSTLALTHAEGDSGVTYYDYTVTRTGNTEQTSTVEWSVPQGYMSLNSGTVTFNPGETQQTIRLALDGDTDVESDQNFTLQLSSPSAGTSVGAQGSASGTITNDDNGVRLASTATQHIAEGQTADADQTFTYTIQRYGFTGETNTAQLYIHQYDPSSYSEDPLSLNDIKSIKLDGVDITNWYNSSQTITFASGESEKQLEIVIRGDAVREDDEWFKVEVDTGSASNSVDTRESWSAQGEVQRDEAQFSILSSEIEGEGNFSYKTTNYEGEESADGTLHVFAVQRSITTAGAASVHWRVVQTNRNSSYYSEADDFVGGSLPSGVVEFEDGQSWAYIEVRTAQDQLGEDNEQFRIELYNPSTGTDISSSKYSTGYITNDDTLFVVESANTAGTVSANEGDTVDGYTPVTVTVHRQGDTAGTDTVHWSFSLPGTAGTNEDNLNSSLWYKLEPNDFRADTPAESSSGTISDNDLSDGSIGGTLTFENGATSQTVTFYIKDDQYTESWYENGTFTITSPSGDDGETPGVEYYNSETVQVVDDDPNPLVSIESAQEIGGVVEGTTSSETGTVNYLEFTLTRTFQTDADENDDLGDYPTRVSFSITGMGYELNTSGTVNTSSFYSSGSSYGGTVDFAAGETTKTVKIPIIADNDTKYSSSENDPTAHIKITGTSGPAQIDTDNQSVDIKVHDDDVRLWVDHFTSNNSIDTVSVSEGNTGDTTDLKFDICRYGEMDRSITLKYTVTYGSADGSDFSSTQGTFTLPPSSEGGYVAHYSSYGKYYTYEVSLPIVKPDTALENNESFTLTLSEEGGASSGVYFSDAFTNNSYDSPVKSINVTGYINTDDVNYSINDLAPQYEGDTGAGAMYSFTITRDGGTGSYLPSATVEWRVTGADVDAADFSSSDGLGNNNGLPSGEVSFAEGETTKTVSVYLNGDITAEAREDFQIEISDPSIGTVIDGVGTSAILPDDSGISISDAGSVIEGGTLTFTVTRSGDLSGESTMDWQVIPGSASSSTDLSGVLQGSLTFAANQDTATITIQTQGDDIPEDTETFEVHLSNFNSSIDDFIDIVGQGVIQNDDAVYSVAAVDMDKTENSGDHTFTITRSKDTAQAQTITWTLSGTGDHAVDAADFGGTLPSGTVTFDPGETSKTITITPQGDVAAEMDESYVVSLTSSDSSASISDTNGSAQGWIRNDDSGFELASGNESFAEGQTEHTLHFAVTRTGSSTGAASVSWALAGSGSNPADAADFGGTLPSGTVHFEDGDTVKYIDVPVSGDWIRESDEEFTLTLSNPTGGSILVGTKAVTLANDDSIVSIAADSAVKAEGDSGVTEFTFTVTRSGDLTGAGTVDWTVAGGDMDESDFPGGAIPSGTVSFEAGQDQAVVTVQVAGDLAPESTENFTVELSNPSAGITVDSVAHTASGTVQADDTMFSVAAVGSVSLNEDSDGGAVYRFTITRTGDVSGVQTVDWAAAGFGADQADAHDFFGDVLPSGSVTFGADETSKEVVFQLNSDLDGEPDETFRVAITPPEGTQTETSTVDCTIVDDEASFRISASDAVHVEGGDGDANVLHFVVTRTGSLALSGDVNWTVGAFEGLTADDFVSVDELGTNGGLPSGTVSFQSGETSKDIYITLKGDTIVENNEAVNVTITTGIVGGDIITSTAEGNIVEDDSNWTVQSVTPLSQNEGDASGSVSYTFTIVRSGSTFGAATVDWELSGIGDNPADAADFGSQWFPSGTVAFADGESSKTVTVTIEGESALEADEGFRITISNPEGSGNDVLTTATVDAVIANDDDVLSIEAADADHAENSGGVSEYTFTLTRAGSSEGESTVQWRISGDVDASDFVTGSGTITFANGETEKTLTLQAVGDTDVESSEGFTVELFNPGAGSVVDVAKASASGTIQNDDTDLNLSAVTSSATEGDGAGGSFLYKIVRTGDLGGETVVNWTVSGDVDAADFAEGVSGTLTFEAGQTEAFISLTAVGDEGVEADENFIVSLSTPTSGAEVEADGIAGVLINDDDTLSITAVDASKLESDSGLVEYVFRVDRTGSSVGTSTVDWNLEGTGLHPASVDDFEAVSGSLTFASGEESKLLRIQVKGDSEGEYNEDFAVTLSNPGTGSSIATATASGVIRNDEATLFISTNDAQLTEGAEGEKTVFTFTVVREGDTSGVTSTMWSVVPAGDHPVQALDFGGALPSGILVFNAGESSKDITVVVEGDNVGEFNEAFKVVLSDTVGGTALEAEAEGSILNDDTALFVSATDAVKEEGFEGQKTVMTFTVTRMGDTAGAASVDWKVAGQGTFWPDVSDFDSGQDALGNNGLPSGTVFFADNETSKTITITILGDNIAGGDEGFTVNLENPTNATISQASASAVIQDDDTVFGVEAVDAVHYEGADNDVVDYTFKIVRSENLSESAEVDWTVTGIGGDPVDADDFAGGGLPSGTVSFAAGETEKLITVQLKGDYQFESTEQFQVAVSTSSNNASIDLGKASAVGEVKNDDGLFLVDALTPELSEGTDGEVTVFKFHINRVGGTEAESTIQWDVSGFGEHAADVTDFVDAAQLSGLETFAVGETEKTISIAVKGDNIIEHAETFQITLSNPGGSNSVNDWLDSAQARIEADEHATIAIAASGAPEAVEGDSGTTDFTYLITRDDASGPETTVLWSVEGNGDNPTDLSDFSGDTSGSVTFAEGETSKEITVHVNGDTQVEQNESFQVKIEVDPDSLGIAEVDAAQSSVLSVVQTDDVATDGVDVLSGTPSDDVITGQGGDDQLTGGGGNDAFHYTSPTDGMDTITDFSAGDTLSFDASAFGNLGDGGQLTVVRQEFVTDVETTLNQLAAQADADVYLVDFDATFTLGVGEDGHMDELETALTDGDHTGAAVIAVSNDDGDTHVYYDADTDAGTDGSGVVEVAQLDNVAEAPSMTDDAVAMA